MAKQPRANSNNGFNCAACIAHRYSLCTGVKKEEELDKQSLRSTKIRIDRARALLFRSEEWSEWVPIICQGWAAYSIIDATGRRQILSFRLPGDLVSMSLFSESGQPRIAQAVTEVAYVRLERQKLKALLDIPNLREKFFEMLAVELIHTEALAFAISRRWADERIAQLILTLSERLAERGMMQDQVMEFPLRRKDIADATGLTTGHVTNVLGSFQEAGLIDMGDRSLTIVNLARLRSLTYGGYLSQ